ncbi:MAG: hypothetical protein ABSC42_10905 [Tepidisphaeraceae bacterium]|jgi:hypothetical protein
MRRKTSNRKGEALAFLVLLGLAGMVALYLNQKPKVVVNTVVVQPAATEPATQEAPPPAVVEAPPPPPPQVVEPVVIAPPPPPPECVIIEAKLRDAQSALAQDQSDLAAASKAAVDRLHKTQDYVGAQADVEEKQKAREDVVAQLAKDTSVGADTYHDEENLRTAAKNILDAKAKLNAMDSDAATADPTVLDKQEALKTAAANISNLRRQLNDYLAKTIADNCATADCAIDSVAIDARSWTLDTKLTPATKPNAGAAADAAMNQIGRIVEKALYKSPFTWTTARFTVYAEYRKKRVPEFRLSYSRAAVEASDFGKVESDHFDNDALLLLAQSVWLSRAANDIQGIPAAAPVVQPATAHGGERTIQYTNTLTIGGYARADGSTCPVSYIRQTHTEAMPPAELPTVGVPQSTSAHVSSANIPSDAPPP